MYTNKTAASVVDNIFDIKRVASPQFGICIIPKLKGNSVSSFILAFSFICCQCG